MHHQKVICLFIMLIDSETSTVNNENGWFHGGFHVFSLLYSIRIFLINHLSRTHAHTYIHAHTRTYMCRWVCVQNMNLHKIWNIKRHLAWSCNQIFSIKTRHRNFYCQFNLYFCVHIYTHWWIQICLLAIPIYVLPQLILFFFHGAEIMPYFPFIRVVGVRVQVKSQSFECWFQSRKKNFLLAQHDLLFIWLIHEAKHLTANVV